MKLTDSPDSEFWVREQVRLMLDGCPAEAVMDTVLVVDELMEDARAYGERIEEVRFGLDRRVARLRVEIDSAPTGALPASPYLTDDEAEGRLLLEQVPLDWGVINSGGYRTAWAVIGLSRRVGS